MKVLICLFVVLIQLIYAQDRWHGHGGGGWDNGGHGHHGGGGWNNGGHGHHGGGGWNNGGHGQHGGGDWNNGGHGHHGGGDRNNGVHGHHGGGDWNHGGHGHHGGGDWNHGGHGHHGGGGWIHGGHGHHGGDGRWRRSVFEGPVNAVIKGVAAKYGDTCAAMLVCNVAVNYQNFGSFGKELVKYYGHKSALLFQESDAFNYAYILGNSHKTDQSCGSLLVACMDALKIRL